MKYQKTLLTMALIAGFLANSGAQATTYSLGPLTAAPTIQFVQITPGVFTDTFNFSISTVSDLAASATNHPLSFGSLNLMDISGFSMSIFDSSGLISGPAGSGISLAGLSLPAGSSYYAEVSGTATGLSGGAYSVAMLALPVPVPAAVWLLGSGLIGLIGVARRKKQA